MASLDALSGVADHPVCANLAVLDDFGLLFEPALQVPTDFGWVPVGPGTCDDGATGTGITGFGHGTLSVSLVRGVFRRCLKQMASAP
jgi:hypothetical protein